MDVLGEISGKDKLELTNKIIHLQQTKDHEYLRGMRNAQKAIYYRFDLAFFADDDVKKAERLAKQLPSSVFTGETVDQTTDVGGALLQVLFYDEFNRQL